MRFIKKVDFFNPKIFQLWWKFFGVISAIFATVFLFIDLEKNFKSCAALIFVFAMIIIYTCIWVYANKLRAIEFKIDSGKNLNSKVVIKEGDIFEQEGFKVIAFNEYFDTQVDDKIIAKKSLNGKYINKFYSDNVAQLDEKIQSYAFECDSLCEINTERKEGKQQKFKLGTVCEVDGYLLTAFSRFDQNNRAYLSMPDYLAFLIRLWDELNRVYAQKQVNVTIFGSGITRIKEHKNIEDEELLNIMLWTFKVSEVRFEHPAKLNIIISSDKVDQINLFQIKQSWSL